MSNKSSRIEVEQRVTTIISMILDGVSHADLIRYGAQKWNVKKRMTEKYISKANVIMKESAKIDREKEIDWHILARKKNLLNAMQKQDYRLAKDILRDMGELQGIYPKKQLEIGTKTIPTTKEEILNALANFALKSGLTLDEYCHREGIELKDFEVTSEPSNIQ